MIGNYSCGGLELNRDPPCWLSWLKGGWQGFIQGVTGTEVRWKKMGSRGPPQSSLPGKQEPTAKSRHAVTVTVLRA